LSCIVSGCETTPVHQLSYSEQKQWASGIGKKCLDQGYKETNPEFKACFRAEAVKNMTERQNNARALAGAAHAFSEGMNEYSRSVERNRTINCRSTSYIRGQINTTCY
jgi:hypothetical protein